MDNLAPSNYADFIRGVCTGLGLSASFFTLAFTPFSKHINEKVKAAINELYTCE